MIYAESGGNVVKEPKNAVHCIFIEERQVIMLNTPSVTASGSQSQPLPRVEPAGKSAVAGVDARTMADSRAVARDQMNVQILASVQVSLKAGDQSQALLFRSAIERINEMLAPTLGPDAIQSKMSEDNSPEATAQRILDLSTGFFDAYAAQRPGDDAEQVAKDFVALIRGGFEQGFNEAKDILDGLKVLGGDIESGIMKTYELVNKGYDEFLASKLGGSNSNSADSSASQGASGVA